MTQSPDTAPAIPRGSTHARRLDRALRLGRRLGPWFYACFAVLFATGAAWYALEAWVARPDPDAGPGPWEPRLLALHGGAAMLALLLLGILLPLHVRKGWKARVNRRAGGALVALCGALVASGYLLYYAGGDSARRAASLVHTWLGLGFPLVLAWHIVAGRRAFPPRAGSRAADTARR